MASYDSMAGKARCGYCNRRNWEVIGECVKCGISCCDGCAILDDKSLTCRHCNLREDLAALGLQLEED